MDGFRNQQPQQVSALRSHYPMYLNCNQDGSQWKIHQLEYGLPHGPRYNHVPLTGPKNAIWYSIIFDI